MGNKFLQIVKIIKEKLKNRKFRNNFLTKNLPAVILILVGSGIIALNIIIGNTGDRITVTEEGFLVVADSELLNMKSIDEKNHELVEIVNVGVGDNVYRSALSSYVEETRQNVDLGYPFFTNNGLTLLMYTSNFNLINSELIRSTGYENMMIFGGKIYDTHDYNQIDDQNYILIAYANGVYSNLYEITVTTLNGTYKIPLNSFLYFAKDQINYYARTESGFEPGIIPAVSLDSLVDFKNESTKEYFQYEYEDFLSGLGTVYKEEKKVVDVPVYTEPVEKVSEEPKEYHFAETVSNLTDKEFVWVKPEVTAGDFTGSVYKATGTIKIKDSARVITKSPTFSFYVNGKLQMRRTYNSSGNITVSGLTPNTKYTVIGEYIYLAEDMDTKINVTFYGGSFETGDARDLAPITLGWELSEYYSTKIRLDNLTVVGDLTNEALNGVARIAIEINDIQYTLSNVQSSYVVNGIPINVSTADALASNTEYDFKIRIYDTTGTELAVINNTGHWHTSSLEPSVVLKVSEMEADSISIKFKLKNKDNVQMEKYRYVVTDSGGNVAASGEVGEIIANTSVITLTDLTANALFNIKAYADIDSNNGKGLVADYQLGSLDFTTLSLGGLGFMSLNLDNEEDSYDSASFSLSINVRKTNAILTRLISHITFSVIDEDGYVVTSQKIKDESLAILKNGDSYDLKFTNLDYASTYTLKAVAYATQGDAKYENACFLTVESFTTTKRPAEVLISSMYTTSNMTDFDVVVKDPDNSILSEDVWVELRNADGVLVKSVKIGKNQETPERIAFERLTQDVVYSIIFYVDDYNITSKGATYQSHFVLRTVEITTEEGISGSISLLSSRRVGNSDNLIDPYSSAKWIRARGDSYWNSAQPTVDEDGVIHLKALSTGWVYYNYDLSEYHGSVVKVSFKVKAYASPTKFYFRQYLFANGGTEIKNVTTDGWTYYETVLKVGYSGNATTYFSPTSTFSYEKNVYDYINFNFSGLADKKTEYLVKEFQVYQYSDGNAITIDTSDVNLEYGYWSNRGVKVANQTQYIRYDKIIEIKKEGWYEMPFFMESNEYTMYMYIYTEGQSSLNWTGAGWYTNSVVKYIPANSRVVIYFRRANGNLTPELDVNIDKSITGIVKDRDISSFTEFTYNLVTFAKIDIEDKRSEIETNDYYVRVKNSDDEYIVTEQYVELEETKKLEGVIKKLNIAEGGEYTVYLSIKIRDRFYDLDSFSINTSKEIIGVSTLNEYFWMQPNTDYVILNDLDFTGVTWYLGRSTYDAREGVIDYQGHTMTAEMQSNGNIFRNFYYLGKNSILKNLVLDVRITGDTTNNAWVAWVYQNSGLMENVYVNIYNENGVIQNNSYRNGYDNILVNRNYGTINNFVFELKDDFKITGNFGLVTLYNYGTISNGYIFGKDIDMTKGATNMTLPKIISTTSAFGATIKNVYVLNRVKIPSGNNQASGVLVGTLGGDMTGVYYIGDANTTKLATGPLVTTAQSAADFSRTYYISDYIYTSGIGQKIPILSLHNIDFQRNTLGDQFDIDDLVSQGYYPQVKFSSQSMPYQTYIELPKIEDSLIDILSSEVIESTDDTAKVKLSINNPYSETITSIVISDMTTEIVEQSFSNGISSVIVNLSNPSSYKSKYAVRSIVSTYEEIPSTKNFLEGERYVAVDMYKPIYTTSDWLLISKNLSWNYALMNDLDFNDFAKFSINSFKGKLKGNNHTISNVFLDGMYGLFYNMYGQIYDLNFYNVQKHDVYGGRMGLINYTYVGTLLDDVHMDTVIFEIPSNYTTTGNVLMGALIAEMHNGCAIYNSSVKNVTFKSANPKISTVYAGGMFGYSSEQNVLYNSYAENVDINIINLSSSYVGGFIGYAYAGIFDSTYVTGSVHSSSSIGTGGYAGWLYSDNFVVTNSIAFVDVCGEKNNVGGFTGVLYGNNTTAHSNIYFGHIFSNMLNSTIHKFAGNRSTYTYLSTNFITDDVMINGDEYNNDYETTITKTSLFDPETYTLVMEFGDGYDYSRVGNKILPRLYRYSSVSEYVEGQSDIYIGGEVLPIVSLTTTVRAREAVVTAQIENPSNLTITGVGVDDMTVSAINNISDIFENNDGKMVNEITFTVEPEKYKDYYRLSAIYYEDEEGEEQTADKYYSIKAIFYGEIWTLADWQAVDSSNPQNYFLMADLDFSQLPEGEKANVGVVFNRLTTESDAIKHTIKNLTVTSEKNTYRIGLIREITGELSNIIFDNINLSSVSTMHTFGIITQNYGTIKNCEFRNSTFETPSAYYVGFVANNDYGILIDNIVIDNVTIKGRERVGALIGYWPNFYDGYVKNIYATNVTIDGREYNGNTNYLGGLMGSTPTATGTVYKDRYVNINISDSTILADLTRSKYVGGAVGYGGCEDLTVDNVTVSGWSYVGGAYGIAYAYGMDSVAKNGHVSGYQYVGGLAGQGSNFTEGTVVYNMDVSGTINVGGFSGYASSSRDYTSYDANHSNVAIYDTTVTGITNVGGMYGSAYYTADLGAYIDGMTISGESNVGGLAGRDMNSAFYNTRGTRMVNSTVTATIENAGGIVGFVESKNSSYSRNVSFENVDIYAGKNAGAFYGKHCADLSNNIHNSYALYFDGTVTAGTKSTAGIVVGEDLTGGQVASQTKWYGLYEGTKLNGTPLKNLNYNIETIISNFSKSSLKPGFLNTSNGSVYTNYSYMNAAYYDYIKLDAGSTYIFEFNQVDDSVAYVMPYYYQANDAKTYISYATGGNVPRYIQQSFSTDYYKEQTIRVLQDCYLRLVIYYPENFVDMTVTRTTNYNYGVSPDVILNAEELKKRITWTTYFSNLSTISNVMKTKLNFSSTYYDISTIGNETDSIVVNDLSGNNANGVAHISGATSDGMWFDGVDDYIEINDNFDGIMEDYTIIAQATIIRSISLGSVFWYMQNSNSDGYYGLDISGTTVYPTTWKSDYWSTGTNMPYNTSTMIAASYNHTNGYIRSYIDGRYDYTRSIGKNKLSTVASNGSAYIGKPASPYNGSTKHNYFYGIIQKVMVFDHVLEDSEIEAIYQAGAPVSTSGLRLYYNLTQYSDASNGGYYPEIAAKYVPSGVNQAHIPLPSINTPFNLSMSSMSMMSSVESAATKGITLEDCYDVYASSANAVNLEFDTDAPSDTTFSYSYGDYVSENMKLSQRVYSLNYNFKDDLTIYFKTASEEYMVTILASDLAKKITMDGENYYYINSDGALYVGNEWLVDNVVNLFGSFALLENGHLYNIETRTELGDYEFQNGMRSDEIPLYVSKIGTKTIRTFYNFSVISNNDGVAVREKQIIMNDNITYIYEQNGANNNLVFNKYNGKVYQFGLDNNGSIITYQTAMKTNKMFNNSEIAEITFDQNNNNPVMMIRYNNGSVRVIDYYSGSTLFSNGEEPSMGLFQFVGAVFTGGAILPTSTSSYEASENLISTVSKIDDTEILKNIAVSTDYNIDTGDDLIESGSAGGESSDGEADGTSGGKKAESINTKVVNTYVSSYNEETGKYETYNVNDLLDPTLDEAEVTSIEEKAEVNAFLYKYLYGDKKDETISESRILIYSAIIVVVFINLGLFVKRFKKHEKKN